MGDITNADKIATAVLNEFEAWPKNRKPLVRTDGVKEWVPLSGIVVQESNNFVCLAVATGMKCLPHNKVVQAQGLALHDWHAEILAIRSLNIFLLEECHALSLIKEKTSKYVRRRTKEEITQTCFQPFAVSDDLILHMYCSEVPCGDASMELTIAAQKDSTPWKFPSPSGQIHSSSNLLCGRSYFSNLGSIRSKPSRPDAPPSLSKSCSDKLCLKQSTSLLSSVTSLLISPENMYINSLIIPMSQYSKNACERAFSDSGRLKLLKEILIDHSWSGGYHFQSFSVYPTSLEFKYSRRQPLPHGGRLSSSNLASFSTQNISGTLIGGTLQGHRQFSIKGAPPMCKRHMWQLALAIAQSTENKYIINQLNSKTYGEFKRGDLLSIRHKVKKDVRCVLGGNSGESGWVQNSGGEDWCLK